VAGPAAGDDGDAGLIARGGAGADVDGLVGGVEGRVGVGQGDALEGAIDEMGRVIDEVFGWAGDGLWSELGEKKALTHHHVQARAGENNPNSHAISLSVPFFPLFFVKKKI
jgi:hypothetical protein